MDTANPGAQQREVMAVMGHRILDDLTTVLGGARTLYDRQVEGGDRLLIIDIIERHASQLEASSEILVGFDDESLVPLAKAIKCAAEITVDAFQRHDRRISGDAVIVLSALLDRCVELLRQLLQTEPAPQP